MKTRVRRLSLVLLAVGLTAWFSGCLSTNYSALIRYDAAADEFIVLNVYQRIAAAAPGDSEYLYQLWRNRDHVIRVPTIDILAMPAFLRISPTKYATLNLGSAPPSFDVSESPVALDQIRVMPGTFFVRGGDNLCYYDQVVIPGKAIDQALVALTKAIGPELTAAIDKELKRRQLGGQRFAWAEARRRMLDQAHQASNPSTQPAGEDSKPPEPLEVLDEESLQLLRQGATDGSIKLTREKQVLRFTLPLSNADTRQVEELWPLIAEAIKADAAKVEAAPRSDSRSFAPVVANLLPALALNVHPGGIELKIDLAIVADHLPAIYGIAKPAGETAPEERPKLHDMIAALRARSVPIDETLTVEDVIKGFSTGTLKSYPSEHPVQPGDGLVQAPPAPGRGVVQPLK